MPPSFDRAIKEIDSILADLSHHYRHYRDYKNVFEAVQDLPLVKELVSENRRLKRELRHAMSASASATSSSHSRRKHREKSSGSEPDCADDSAGEPVAINNIVLPVPMPVQPVHVPVPVAVATKPRHEPVVEQKVLFVRNPIVENAIVAHDNVPCVETETTVDEEGEEEATTAAVVDEQDQEEFEYVEEEEEVVEEEVEYVEEEEVVEEEVEYVEEEVEYVEEEVEYVEEEEEAVEEEVEYVEEEEEAVEEEEEELVEITVKGKSYYASNTENSQIYAIDVDGDVGKEVGCFRDGKASFY